MEKLLLKTWFLLIFFQKCIANTSNKDYALFPPLFHQDNYDKCMLLEDEALYCSFEYHLVPLDNDNPMWDTIQKLSADPYNYNHYNLRHWICVPLTCPNYKKSDKSTNETLNEVIKECYDKKFHSYGFRGHVKNLKCETTEPKYPVDWIDKGALVFFVSYALLVLSCTFYELLISKRNPEAYQKQDSSKLDKKVLAFSLIKNWKRLISVNESSDVKYLKPLQGVRFYNTILVILSHTALTTTMLPNLNHKYVETMNSKVANSFLSSGPLCVSTFFFMSATILSYGIFNEFEHKKLSVKVLKMTFVNRYIRLAPGMGIIILFNLSWWRHLGDGPQWNDLIGKEFLRCRANWWTNMLFINVNVNRENMCTPTFWYLALDTQYFIMLLILLWYIKKHEKYIWQILGILLFLNIIGTFIRNYIGNFEALAIPRAEEVYHAKYLVGNPHWHGQMCSTIGNTAGPIMGVGFGYIAFKTKGKELFKTSKLMWKILYYFLCAVPAVGIIVVPGWYVLNDQRYTHDPVIASIIAALGRPVFLFGIAFGIFTAMHSIGGPIEHILNWYPVYMLARIAYSAYLVHMTVIMLRPASTRTPVYVSDWYIVYYLLGDVASSYIIGTMMTLLFEMPMSALQKLMMPDKKSEVKKKE